MKLITKLSVLITYSILAFNIYAENFLYITDQVEIPIRSEDKISNNIIITLPSGTKLSVLKVTENNWTKIKYNNITGWIMSRYLSVKAPSKIELKKVTEENNTNKLALTKLQSTKEKLELEAAKIKNENEQLQIQNSKIMAEKQHMEEVYKNTLAIEHEKTQLNKAVLQLKEELRIAKNNDQIENDRISRNWFIAGSVVLFLGMIIGFIVQRKINKKQRY